MDDYTIKVEGSPMTATPPGDQREFVWLMYRD